MTELEQAWGRTMVAALPVPTSDVRSNYHQMSDGVSGLVDVVDADPVLRRDRRLQVFMEKLVSAETHLRRHLDRYYQWD